MNFQPKTEEECRRLIPDGIYDFEVVDSVEKVSGNGNDMIAVKLKLYDGERTVGVITDNLMQAIAYKLRHAAYACGIGDKYESGNLGAADFHGATGRVKVVVRKADKKYPKDRNAIADYLVGEKSTKRQANVDDEPLPF